MGLDNHIEYAMKGLLKNPILTVLKEIKIVNILKQNNFNKRNTGYSVFTILLHFVYMLVMNKRQSSFLKQSKDAYGKDTYYRFTVTTLLSTINGYIFYTVNPEKPTSQIGQLFYAIHSSTI